MRLKGVQLDRKITYGSQSYPILDKTQVADPSHTHRWTLFVRSATGDDITTFIKKVQFKLHDSFVNPNRVVEQPPFEVTETGWGEFDIVIKIFFVDPTEKPQTIHHHLQLYPKEEGGMNIQKPVLSEHYDEVVFNEPTAEMKQILDDNPESELEHPTFSKEREQEELQKLAVAHEEVMNLFEKYKSQLNDTDQELRQVQAEIRRLENED